jgi:hypothetical protein
MSGASEAEASRLRVGPYVAKPGKESPDWAAGNAETRMIAVVDAETAGPDASGKSARDGSDAAKADAARVRAVAREATAALPVLDSDGPREAPPSAKTTLDDRRRAQDRASTDKTPSQETAAEATTAGEDAASTGAKPAAGATHMAAPSMGATPAAASATDVTPAATLAMSETPVGSDAAGPTTPPVALLAQPAAPAATHDAGRNDAAEHQAPTRQQVERFDMSRRNPPERPLALPPPITPFPPVPDPPAVHRPAPLGPPLLRRDVDDSSVDTVTDGVPVAAAPVPQDLVPVPGSQVPVFNNQVSVPQQVLAPVPEVLNLRAAPPAQPRGAIKGLDPAAANLVRPGPPVLDADPWDVPPENRRANDLYHGKRRATIPWGRVLLIVALLAGVGALFAIPVALNKSSAPSAGLAGGSTATGDVVGVPGATNEAGELVSAASSPGGSTAPATKSSRVPPTTPPARATPPQAPPPATFAPVVIRAENATVSASWQKDANPSCTAGTRTVRTGNWYGTEGVLTFNVPIATAGSYNMRIYFAAQPTQESGPRKAEITVNNASVATPDFPLACNPLGVRDVTISLDQSNNEIRFGNQNDPGPSIDRIEISKP